MEVITTILSLISTFFLANLALAIFVIISERRNPASTWAWILVLFFIPVFGFIFYMIFGRDHKKQRVFQEKSKQDMEQYNRYIRHNHKYEKIMEQQKKTIEESENIFGSDDDFLNLNDLVYLNINAGSWMTKNNSVLVYNNGETKFFDLIHDIRNAKNYIHIQYYIIRDDTLGRMIIRELAYRAQDGIEVKLLYDGMGCHRCGVNFFDPITDSGGEVCAFLPPLFIRINYRNHRKLCVIDGQIGYIGGFNIGDEYLGIEPRYGFWRDTHMRLTGDAVDQLQLRFLMDWNFSAEKKVSLAQSYFPVKEENGNINMQVVSSGPDTPWPNVQYAYFKMITEAEKSIYIETPYFVPDDSILEALRVAALSGIDVRIIIPGNPDHPFVYWASLSYLGELLDAGVKCYRYERGFIHCKVILVDGMLSSVGTANMDVRSFKLNFEVNSFIYDKDTNALFEKEFMNDLVHCTQITKEFYAKRSFTVKLRESFSRLISPML